MRQPGSNLKLERDKLTQDLAKFSQTFKVGGDRRLNDGIWIN